MEMTLHALPCAKRQLDDLHATYSHRRYYDETIQILTHLQQLGPEGLTAMPETRLLRGLKYELSDNFRLVLQRSSHGDKVILLFVGHHNGSERFLDKFVRKDFSVPDQPSLNLDTLIRTPPQKVEIKGRPRVRNAPSKGRKPEWWNVILPTDQSKWVKPKLLGSTRLRGPSGCGKTMVLLHRVRRIADESCEGSVNRNALVLSRNEPIAEQLKDLINSRPHKHPAARIQVETVDQLCLRLVRQSHICKVDSKKMKAHFGAAIRSNAPALLRLKLIADPVSQESAFISDELEFIFGKFLASELPKAYLECDRHGRGRALNQRQRELILKIYCAVLSKSSPERPMHSGEIVREARALLAGGVKLPDTYEEVLIDESQTMTEMQLHVLKLIAEQMNCHLFLAGDDAQSVYTGGFSLKSVGIDIVGRSAVLRNNYRNSPEVVAALECLSTEYPCLRGEGDDHLYKSVQNKTPTERGTLVHSSTLVEEIDWVVKSVGRLLAREEVKAGTICIMAQGHQLQKRIRDALHQSYPDLKIGLNKGAQVNRNSLKVTTIQSTIGQEFRFVYIVNAVTGALATREFPDPEEEQIARLLYTGIGRATDWLAVTHSAKSKAEELRAVSVLASVCDCLEPGALRQAAAPVPSKPRLPDVRPSDLYWAPSLGLLNVRAATGNRPSA